jgi:hypothetical protein
MTEKPLHFFILAVVLKFDPKSHLMLQPVIQFSRPAKGKSVCKSP